MVPSQHHHDKETNNEGQGNAATHAFRPAELLRDNVDALEERESRGDISYRPLHQLALLQALQELVHRAAAFSSPTGDCNSLWKRGSLRSGSQNGSSLRFAIVRPAGTLRRCGNAANAAS